VNRSLLRLAPTSLAIFAVLVLACQRRPTPDPTWAKEVEAFRAKRIASLTREEGWLSLVGLSWLKPGENVFGSDPAGAIVLTAPGIPARAGAFELRPDGAVFLKVESGASVAVNGAQPPSSGAPLATDRTGKPDVVTIGRLRLAAIQRADRFAIRVRDPESSARTGFKGIETFPLDSRLKVNGTFEPFAAPKEVDVPSAHGPAQKMFSAGIVRFRIGNRELSFEPFVDGPGDDTFFFVFRDRTAGTETYGAGRFLNVPAPKEGSKEVTLDFNRAINPPCAFTPFATCPLPLPQNDLPVRIEAGEKAPAGH
jgi:uncharacterized protein (DUF1684 family)